MSCSKIEAKLKAWIDGELSGKRAAIVERHLRSCSRCREQAEDYRGLTRILRGAGAPFVLPVAQTASIRGKALRARRDEERVVRLLQRTAAAAAAVLLVAIGLAVSPLRGTPERESFVEGPVDPSAVDYDDALAAFLTNLEPLTPLALGGGN